MSCLFRMSMSTGGFSPNSRSWYQLSAWSYFDAAQVKLDFETYNENQIAIEHWIMVLYK